MFVPFRIIENDKTITFIGGETISRYDYNVGNDFDTFKIGEEISVEVNCIINKD